MFTLAFILAVLQASPPVAVRGDRFQIAVPQGWKTLSAGGDVALEHSTGASLLIRRVTATRNLEDFAHQQAERVMTPLGFAKLGEPKHFKDSNGEWVQYDIRGNRLSDHRRILYRAVRHGSGYFELVYENNEKSYDVLLTEAEEIASSVQAIIQAPAPPPKRPVARR